MKNIDQSMSSVKPVMWTQEDALQVLKYLEPVLATQGYHCALAGSILYQGTSTKDLDVIIYPHAKTADEVDLRSIKKFLRGYFLAKNPLLDCGRSSRDTYYDDVPSPSFWPNRDEKKVSVIITSEEKRIDFFFLS